MLKTCKYWLLIPLIIMTITCKGPVRSEKDLAMAYVDNGLFHKAIPMLEKLKQEDPEDPLLLRYYGFALRANVDSTETPEHSCKRMYRAIDVWKEWLAIEPTTDGYVGVGSWYSWIGEYDSSLVYLKKSIDFTPRGNRHPPGEEEFKIAQTFFLAKEPDSTDKYLDLAEEKGYPRAEPKLIPNPCKLAIIIAEIDSANQVLTDSLGIDSSTADSTIELKVTPVQLR